LLLTVLEGAGLGDSNASTARGGFRIGFGAAMLVAAWIIAHHRVPDGPKAEPSWKARLRGANPGVVYVTGIVLYAPSGSYLAAVQQIATGHAALPSVVQLLIVIAIVLVTVEAPLLAYAIRPDATSRLLVRIEGWIARHGRKALVIGLVGIGTYLVIDGILTLVD
jgi:hypothetical protein